MNRAKRSMAGLAIGVMSIGFATGAAAQDTVLTGFSWGVGQSLSDTKTFSNDFSFRNADAEIRKIVGQSSFGASIGWHVFHDEVLEARELENYPVTVAGLQFRNVNTIPITLTAHRYFGSVRQTRAYIGVGAGTAWTQRSVDIGIFRVDEDSWGFTAIPEVGFIINSGGPTEWYVNAKYQWTSGDNGASALYFNIGVFTGGE